MKKTIYLTEFDFQKLEAMMVFHRGNRYLEEHMKALSAELENAVLLGPDEMPDHIVTMHTRASLKNLNDGGCQSYTLVYPEEANFGQGKISVLAPLGVAMIGQEIGDVIEIRRPSEPLLSYSVERILYQPEANGVFEAD